MNTTVVGGGAVAQSRRLAWSAPLGGHAQIRLAGFELRGCAERRPADPARSKSRGQPGALAYPALALTVLSKTSAPSFTRYTP